MATVDTQIDQLEDLRDRTGWYTGFKRFLRKQPLGSAGLFIVVVMVVVAIFAPQLSSLEPESNSFETMFIAPGAEFFLGTDDFGRDVLTRIMYGARTALFVGLTSAFIGSTVGLRQGYVEKRIPVCSLVRVVCIWLVHLAEHL